MNFNNRHNNSTFTMRVICAIVFSLFTFCFLYFFQADVLAAEQHILSGGLTHYSRLIGAVLITVLLQLLQLGIYTLTRLNKRSHALTYFPSCLLLAFITGVKADANNQLSMGSWIWVTPFLLIVYVGLIYMAKAFQPYEPQNPYSGFISRSMWINILILNILFILVGLFSNSDELFHYRMRMESCMLEGKYECALHVGKKASDTDNSLTMLRIYALSRTGKLGEELFSYPVSGGSDALLPSSKASTAMYPSDCIFRYLGAIPKQKLQPMTYLYYMCKYHKANNRVGDYLLCGYLLDRKIDLFVKMLPLFYKIDEHLPKYYKEALILYTHLRTNPVFVFHSTVLDTDYQDFTDMQNQNSNKVVRANTIRDNYGDTYWCYFYYDAK